MVSFKDVVSDAEQAASDVDLDHAYDLVDTGAVTIHEVWAGLLTATVADGPRAYAVRIAWDHEGYAAQCACSLGHRATLCSHVCAALALADQEGVLDADRAVSPSSSKKNKSPAAPPAWRKALDSLRSMTDVDEDSTRKPIPAGSQILYIVDHEGTLMGKGIVLETAIRTRKLNGDWSKPKALSVAPAQIRSLADPIDRMILAMLVGGTPQSNYYYGRYDDYGTSESRRLLLHPLAAAALPLMCRQERCFLRAEPRDGLLQPLRWGEDRPWQFRLEVQRNEKAGKYGITGLFVRGDERMEMTQPELLTSGGLVFHNGMIEPLDDGGAFEWIGFLRKQGTVNVPLEHGPDFLQQLHSFSRLPQVELPEELRLEEVKAPLSVHLIVRKPKKARAAYGYGADNDRLVGDVRFAYEGNEVKDEDGGRAILQLDRRRMIVRDREAEAAAMERLRAVGFRRDWHYDYRNYVWQLAPSKLAKAVTALTREGWHVQADGKLYRQPGEFTLEVSSGIDWFDLNGSVNFGDQVVQLPQLLAALRRGENLVQLGDGSVGMLPEEWLKKYGLLVNAGQVEGDSLRFTRTQTGLLDALLAAEPQATCDATFARIRQELRSFDGIAPADAPETFRGTLRPYQQEGLGWLDFLRRFGFGGCLADDMGLGKTVQVLAMLEGRKGGGEEVGSRQHAVGSAENCGLPIADRGLNTPNPQSEIRNPKSHGPSLVVVPRSLIFNWMEEAKRFAPNLRVLDQSHAQRTRGTDHLSEYDIVLTTYGTLRRDAAYLKDVVFDYVVLDEAQAIKNPASESAKAARLLKGHHRLALSGTPIQNHLGDLWSLFEFLNPGMLGTSSVFSSASSALRNPDDQTRQLLARALRPFILRRTKEQVARDLPARLEQTIHCELEPAQRKLYDELRNHYRASLLETVASQGMNKAKIQILEALLRLRQCACHPALIDKARAKDSSAKLDLLLSRMAEVVEEGHKVLVFSQFTSFLSLVRKQLDKQKIVYEYLDGQTRDRQARVDRFQTDPDCRAFLISLKAGGLGLNLTAADYVFLLDPWWNPAIEAQAIDRAHRIGQDKQVFAFRLIAKDTVEEKVLQLQEQKRALADAIISADDSLLRTLDREDLEMLLS